MDLTRADPTDRPGQIRPGEELPIEPLTRFLTAQIPGASATLEILQFPRGYSNLTYLVRSGTRDLVLRRPPFGAAIKTAHDMGREYRILSRLADVYPRVPRPLACCDDESVLGAPFYVMERVSGVILRAAIPDGLELAPQTLRRLSTAFIENLADIHAIDYAGCGLGDLGRPEGYVSRQIDGWTRRYQNARTDDVAEIERTAVWLAGHVVAESGAALIHNDYKYDNLVLDPADVTRITAVLDWEMATIGDPLMDLGTTLAYWADPGDPLEWRRQQFGLTTLPGNLDREELVHQYATSVGRDVADLVFHYVYGLFKIAVIVQQIYRRYRLGFTSDARFGGLAEVVRSCGTMAVRAIERDRIDRLGD